MTVSNGNLIKMQIWTVKDDKVYTITYTTSSNNYSHNLPIIEEIINSFKLVDRTNSDYLGIPIGFSPTSLAVGNFPDTLYIANSDSNTVSLMNLSSDSYYRYKIIDYIEVDSVPTSIAVSDYGYEYDALYVANSESNTISVYIVSTSDGNKHRLHDTIEVDNVPTSIVISTNDVYIDSYHDRLYVANNDSNTISVYLISFRDDDDDKHRLLETIEVDSVPTSIADGGVRYFE